ncbi:putative pyoverdine/dityrosine biosynthesis protein [Planoprotostelium fungivorum]|uniref:Putative pyoverdine/dityrosine biosynthesis protein n=1 Tax=Planoprotostelium fungivorum TaxID=1890364 RepID=A0A2P6NEW3_9EUKA|nr:putative pyoverdine/dityrosine biosynthesis protein [Planoprotostelium fungivorum]
MTATHTSDADAIVDAILDVLEKYRQAPPSECVDQRRSGRALAASSLKEKILDGTPIRLVLPAFPFKSPNHQEKTLGSLPDRAEEWALAHLNGLCASIREIYPSGVILDIVSDGSVYNGKFIASSTSLILVELLGVDDHEVYQYGEAIRRLSEKYTDIHYHRLSEVLEGRAVKNEEDFIGSISRLRDSLLQGARGDDSIDSNLTNAKFRDFLRCDLAASSEWMKGRLFKLHKRCLEDRRDFLRCDLAASPEWTKGTNEERERKIIQVAQEMSRRQKAFSAAIQNTFSTSIRLSIHPSSGQDKYSISFVEEHTDGVTTPWHGCILFKCDGSVVFGHRSTFENDPQNELVYFNQRPSHFQEKSVLYQWETPAIFNHQYPCGIIVHPAPYTTPSFKDVDMDKLRRLSQLNSPVILRGFSNTKDRQMFTDKAHQMGEVQRWIFGEILEVKDGGNNTGGLNNVLSSEPMPFHFDGNFKTKKILTPDGEEKIVPDPPSFQMFTSITPSPKNTGYTLFSPSRLIFHHLPAIYPLPFLKKCTWTCITGGFNETKLTKLPLITLHPSLNTPCLRFHEPWPQEKTAFQPTFTIIEGQQDLTSKVVDLLYDKRVCYWHSWEEGDVLGALEKCGEYILIEVLTASWVALSSYPVLNRFHIDTKMRIWQDWRSCAGTLMVMFAYNKYLIANTKANDLTKQQQSKQYNNQDAKYELYKIEPYSGLRNSAYEKECNAGHTNRATGIRVYVSKSPADFKGYLDEISAETKYLSTISRLIKHVDCSQFQELTVQLSVCICWHMHKLAVHNAWLRNKIFLMKHMYFVKSSHKCILLHQFCVTDKQVQSYLYNFHKFSKSVRIFNPKFKLLIARHVIYSFIRTNMGLIFPYKPCGKKNSVERAKGHVIDKFSNWNSMVLCHLKSAFTAIRFLIKLKPNTNLLSAV